MYSGAECYVLHTFMSQEKHIHKADPSTTQTQSEKTSALTNSKLKQNKWFKIILSWSLVRIVMLWLYAKYPILQLFKNLLSAQYFLVFMLGEAYLVSSTPALPPSPGRGRHCSHQFCIDNEYEKLDLPPPTNKSRVTEVIITPHILEIFEVLRMIYDIIQIRFLLA